MLSSVRQDQVFKVREEATDFGIPTINLQTIPCLGYPSFTDLNIRAFGLGRRNLHGGRKNQNFEGL